MGCQSSVPVHILPETCSVPSIIAKDTDRISTPVLQRPRNFQWFWCRNVTTEREEQWQKFTDIENEIIEDGFNDKKLQIDLDGDYVITLTERFRYKKDRPQKRNKIKRVRFEIDKDDGSLRKDRFCSPVPLVDQISLTINDEAVEDVTKIKGPTRLPRIYWTLELDKKNKTMANLVEDAAYGILKQGTSEGRLCEARWLSEQLLAIKHFGNNINALHYFKIPKIIGETCIYIHTKESFWYKFIYELLKNPDVVTIEQLKIIGPFCHLLHWFMKNDSMIHKPVSTIYRSLHVTNEQHSHEWMKTSVKFLCFTSTTKNRTKAEQIGNALLIIDLNIRDAVDDNDDENDNLCCGTDISFLSAHSQEEEYLIWPGTDFYFVKYEFDNNKNKHLIYLNSSRYSYL